jgi:hypothetical protein
MKKQPLIVLVALAMAGAAFAQADPATPRVDRRQANQQKRIQQGVASGQLTPKETRRLQAQQDRIATAEAEAKSDGVVTRKERAGLTARQNRANRNVYRNKHDAQAR